MIVKTKEFQKILKYLKTCLPTNSLIPILNHICFKDDKVFVFNGIESIVIEYKTGLNCAVLGKLLCDFVSTIDAKEIEITQTSTKLEVKVGKKIAKFEIITEDKFIYYLPEVTPISQITVNDDFINGIKKCLISTGTDTIQVNQYGITFYNNSLYSSDGIRLSKYKFSDIYELGDVKILFPKGFCEIIGKIDINSACVISFCDNTIVAEFQLSLKDENDTIKLIPIKVHTSIFSDVTFLDFEQHIESIKDKTEFYPNSVFQESIDNCNLFLLGNSEKVIEFTIQENIVIESKGKFGNYNDSLDTKSLENIGKFKVDINLFKQLLNTTTFISFKKCDNTVIIIGKEGNYLHLLMSFVIKE